MSNSNPLDDRERKPSHSGSYRGEGSRDTMGDDYDYDYDYVAPRHPTRPGHLPPNPRPLAPDTFQLQILHA